MWTLNKNQMYKYREKLWLKWWLFWGNEKVFIKNISSVIKCIIPGEILSVMTVVNNTMLYT